MYIRMRNTVFTDEFSDNDINLFSEQWNAFDEIMRPRIEDTITTTWNEILDYNRLLEAQRGPLRWA